MHIKYGKTVYRAFYGPLHPQWRLLVAAEHGLEHVQNVFLEVCLVLSNFVLQCAGPRDLQANLGSSQEEAEKYVNRILSWSSWSLYYGGQTAVLWFLFIQRDNLHGQAWIGTGMYVREWWLLTTMAKGRLAPEKGALTSTVNWMVSFIFSYCNFLEIAPWRRWTCQWSTHGGLQGVSRCLLTIFLGGIEKRTKHCGSSDLLPLQHVIHLLFS